MMDGENGMWSAMAGFLQAEPTYKVTAPVAPLTRDSNERRINGRINKDCFR